MANDFLSNTLKIFKEYQSLGDKALERMDVDQLHWEPNVGSNSAAVIVKHMSGNMRSRFTEFLTTDGEKPNRNRDAEFTTDAALIKEEILALWRMGWNVVYAAVEPLTEADLQRVIFIRGEEYTVTRALQRQIAHYAYHVGQLVFLSKMFAGENWESLSIPRGASDDFNERMRNARKS